MKSAARKNALLKVFSVLDRDLADLDADLQRVGERDLADAVKRARRELELIRRLGVYEDRGV
jgi:hypothetical protein